MILKLVVSGDETVLELGLDKFCRQHGWTEDLGVDKLEFAGNTMKRFMRESIQAYATVEAQKAAATAAAEQIGAALDTTETVLTQE